MQKLLKNLKRLKAKNSFSETFINFLPKCQNCPRPSYQIFCEDCFELLRFRSYCSLCGHIPLTRSLNFCLKCRDKNRLWDNLYFSFFYQGGVRSWLYDIKENYNPERLKELNHKFLPRFKELPDALIPVSSDPVRFKRRLFNPAAQLAKRLGKILGIPVIEDLFMRTPFLEAQKELSLEDRRKYLKQTIRLKKPLPTGLKRLVLVDDVMTSGATLEVHSNLLKGAASQMDVYCLARTPKNTD